MRLDKFLAHNGFGTRKDVKGLIKKKLVTVNGIIAKDSGLNLDVNNDIVMVDGIEIFYTQDAYFMINKPAGYECTHKPDNYPSVLELLDEVRNDLIFVGRLDADTEGLLFITNDGKFAHNIASGKKEIRKKYYVELAKPFDKRFIDELEKGIPMDEEMLKPAFVEVIDSNKIYLSIAEGKYHQVKRMMHYCDNEVTYLKRVAIGNVELDTTLELGEYRPLTEEEMNQFI